MNKISIKLAAFFLGIIFFSTLLSFLAVMFLSRQVEEEIARDQRELAMTIQALRSQTSLSIEDIISVIIRSNYRLRPVGVLDPTYLGPDAHQNLDEDGIVILHEGPFKGTSTVLHVGDAYVRIGMQPQYNIFQIWFSRLWNSFALYLLIAAALVVALTRKVVHPVLELTEATQEVAKGNFDIQIESSRNDEIGRLTDNFNLMVRQLRDIEYLRKDFISNVSHEIKTPLASIRGFAALLQNPGITEEERVEYSEVIVEEATRLANLSSTLLSLTKLENQERVETHTQFYLDEQIRHAVLVLEPHWSRKSLRFHIELQEVEIQANEELLQQVWVNLISNAIKFSPDEAEIELRLTASGRQAEVVVCDHGIGISRENLPRIFEKFFQVESSRSGEGSGLGLSLVKRIIDLQHGSIGVDSTPGEGTRFVVTLPLNGNQDGSSVAKVHNHTAQPGSLTSPARGSG